MLVDKNISLAEIAKYIDGECIGDSSTIISKPASLKSAKKHHISFFENAGYKKDLLSTQAGAILLRRDHANLFQGNKIVVDHPLQAFIRVIELFQDSSKEKGIHPTAVVGKNCHIHESAIIGPYCVIGDHCSIGANSYLQAHVTLCPETIIGDRVVIQSGVVIGAEGFGFARDQAGWIRIPQIAKVIVGHDVEIGANTTIDRGALEDTIIEDGVKLDNQILIAHGVRIGKNTIIAGCTGIAGSTQIGRNCMIGGACMISDHIEIADNVVLTGATFVCQSILEAGVYSSQPITQTNKKWRRNSIYLQQLEEWIQRVKKLEKNLEEH